MKLYNYKVIFHICIFETEYGEQLVKEFLQDRMLQIGSLNILMAHLNCIIVVHLAV